MKIGRCPPPSSTRHEIVYARKLEARAALVKALVSMLILSLVVFYLVALVDEGISFECTGRWSFCTFRYFSMALSGLLLAPFVVESLDVFGLIFDDLISSRGCDSGHVFLISDSYEFRGLQKNSDDVVNDLEKSGVLKRIFSALFYCTILLFMIPVGLPAVLLYAFICGTAENKGAAMYILVIIPEFLLSMLFIPLSVLVINSSTSLTDILVNLVALQIFSQLDDVVVRMLLRPMKSIGTVLDSYLGPIEHRVRLDMENRKAMPLQLEDTDALL